MNHRKSSNEFSRTTCKIGIMKFVRQKNTEELNNSGKEEVGFSGKHVGGFAIGNAQGIFQRVNRALHTSSAVIDLRKSRIISGDARIQA